MQILKYTECWWTYFLTKGRNWYMYFAYWLLPLTFKFSFDLNKFFNIQIVLKI